MKKRIVSLAVAASMLLGSLLPAGTPAYAAEPTATVLEYSEFLDSDPVDGEEFNDDSSDEFTLDDASDFLEIQEEDAFTEEDLELSEDTADAEDIVTEINDTTDLQNAISSGPISDEEYQALPETAEHSEKYDLPEDDVELYHPLRLTANEDEIRYTVLVLDNSGTVSFIGSNGSTFYTADTAVRYVKQAAQSFLNSLEKAPGTNYVAIITYADTAVTVSDFSQDYSALRSKVSSIYSKSTRRDMASGIVRANELLDNITDKDVIKNTVLFTTGMTDNGDYNYTGHYSEFTIASNWRRTDNEVRLYAYANNAYEKAMELKKTSYLYTLGLFQTMKDIPAEGADVASFFRLVAKELATSPDYFYPVSDPNNLDIAFGRIADDINGEYQKITFAFDKGNTAVCYYSDKYFDNSSLYINPSLATMTMSLAMSAFGAPPEGDNYGDASKYAKELLKKIGIPEDNIRANDWYYKKPDTDSIGVITGNKQIKDSFGKAYTLIPVMVRGGGYEREWASNFTIGSSGQHKGFSEAKDNVIKFLKDYVKEQNITGPVKFWVTGYSRAAATANLVSAALDDGIDFGNDITYDMEDVYAYTFETPAGARRAVTHNNYNYINIVNYINPADPVPYVAPSDWGFSRYGRDKYLPAKGTTTDYNEAQAKMLAIYNQINLKEEYAVDNFKMKKISVLKRDIVDDDKNPYSQGVYLSNYVSILASDFFKSRDNYNTHYQAEIREICNALFGCTNEQMKVFLESLGAQAADNWPSTLAYYILDVQPIVFWKSEEDALRHISNWIIKALDDAGIEYDKKTVDSAGIKLSDLLLALLSNHPNYAVTMYKNIGGIGGAHYPELCYSWLASMDPNYEREAQDTTNNGSYRVIRINCEVDVEVKDNRGNTVAQIIDESPVENSASLLCGINENGEKIVILPADVAYNVCIKAREDDTVDYGIAEYNATAGGYTRVINYFDMDLAKGKTINSTVPAYSEAELENNYDEVSQAAYLVYDSNGNQVKPNSELQGEEAQAAYYSAEAVSDDETMGTALGTGSYQFGSYALLTAVPYEGYALEGWYLNDEKVSTDDEYRIRVEKDITVVAKFKAAPKSGNGDILDEDMPEDGIIPEGIWVAGVEDAEYTGKAIKQSFRVYDYNKLLREKTDYTVSYKNNVKACDSKEDDRSPRIVLKMKGNYKGTKNIYFSIKKGNLSDTANVKVSDITVSYNGKKQTPTPTVYYKGRKLKAGKDYYVYSYEYYRKNKKMFTGSDAGMASFKLTINSKGNYTGSASFTLNIVGTRKDALSGSKLTNVLMKNVSVSSIPNQTFAEGGVTLDSLRAKDGSPLKLQLKYKGKLLTEGSDFVISAIENNKDVGTASLILKGLEANYSSTGYSFVGEKRITFKIVAKDIGSAKVTGLQKYYSYTGGYITPCVRLNGIPATYYQTTYENNVNAGTGKIIMTGRNGYKGIRTVDFKIVPHSLNDDAVTVEENIVAAYAKGGAKPSIAVTFKGKDLVQDRDFKVKYSGNKALSDDKGVAVITGTGNFKGQLKVNFAVTKRSFSDGITARAEDVTEGYRTGWFAPAVSVFDTDGSLLKSGTDYEKEIRFFNETKDGYITGEILPNAGDVIRAEITGKGAYTDDVIITTFRVIPADKSIKNMTIKLANQEYTGKAITIDSVNQITAAYIQNGKDRTYLEYGKDFIFEEYKNNITPGTATLIVKGIGEYGGSQKATFRITSRFIENWWKGLFR